MLRDHPQEAEAIEGLATLLAKSGDKKLRWTLDRLADLLHPKSKTELAEILGRFIEQGALEYEIQVESPNGEVLGRYKDIREIPPSIPNNNTGTVIPISPDLFRFVYTVPRRDA